MIVGANGHFMATRIVSTNENFSANENKRSHSLITPSQISTPINDSIQKMVGQNKNLMFNQHTPGGKQGNQITPINHNQRQLTPNQF